MPLVPSTFAPPWWARLGHLQTILPTLWPRVTSGAFTGGELPLPDGDVLQLDWQRGGSSRLAILTHGLEGDTAAGYIRGMAETLQAAGWDVLAWCLRGCGPKGNRLLRSYHSGESGDLRALVEHAAPAYEKLALVGFSLGGNITLKYLGEAPPHPAIVCAAAVSAPVDLASSADRLDEEIRNVIYRRRFLHTLREKMRHKASAFPGQIAEERLASVHTLRAFDEHFTAPLHGFAGAADYYARASSRPFLPALRLPALLLNAGDDPLLAPASFPFPEARASPFLFLETPAAGGHVGFLDFRHGRQPWFERRVAEFLQEHLA